MNVALVGVLARLQGHRPGLDGGAADRGLLVHARPEQVEVVQRGLVLNLDCVLSGFEYLTAFPAAVLTVIVKPGPVTPTSFGVARVPAEPLATVTRAMANRATGNRRRLSMVSLLPRRTVWIGNERSVAEPDKSRVGLSHSL